MSLEETTTARIADSQRLPYGKVSPLVEDASHVLSVEFASENDVVQIAPNLLNTRALPDAQVTSITWAQNPHKFVDDDLVEMTTEDLESVGLNLPTIQLGTDVFKSKDEPKEMTFHAKNGIHFTVAEVFDCVLETENVFRLKSKWFGGVDQHHVFFEGLIHKGGNVFQSRWGS